MACSGTSPSDATITHSDCPTVTGVDALLSKTDPRIIVLGELHGTKGAPAFAESLLCHSLARGNRTAFGFEISDDAEGRISTFLKSDGGGPTFDALYQHSMFQTNFTVGRSSDAIVQLLDAVRAEQPNGASPFLFQATEADYSQYQDDPSGVSSYHEKGMADNILRMARSSDFDKTIVLVGNCHASRGRLTYGELDYALMANHMPPPETTTLLDIHTLGTSWNCVGTVDGGTRFGANKTGGYVDQTSELAKTGKYEIIIGKDPRLPPKIIAQIGGDYDGVYFVGAAVASPPANLDGRKFKP